MYLFLLFMSSRPHYQTELWPIRSHCLRRHATLTCVTIRTTAAVTLCCVLLFPNNLSSTKNYSKFQEKEGWKRTKLCDLKFCFSQQWRVYFNFCARQVVEKVTPVSMATRPTNHMIYSRAPIGYLKSYTPEQQSFTNLAQVFNKSRKRNTFSFFFQ